MLEGPDLVHAALDSSIEFEAIYVDEEHIDAATLRDLQTKASTQGVRLFSLAPGVLERVADSATPQPVLAAVRLPLVSVDDIDCTGLILVLHDVRDPGNAGTLIRSADAAGASGVVFTGQSVDPFNPKTLRATAGSIFHIPIACGPLESSLASFRSRGATVLATVVRGGVSHRNVDYSSPLAVVIGNEAFGLDEATVALCGGSITIDMVGESESLNAGVAGSLIAFEAMWRRQDTTSVAPPPNL